MIQMIQKDIFINHLSRNELISKIIGLFLCSAPLFMVTIRGWTNSILIIGAFLSFIYLIFDKQTTTNSVKNYSILFIFIVSLPVIVVGINSISRMNLHLQDFDSPLRFILGIPILLFIYRTKFNSARYLQYIIPLSLLITIFQQYTFNQPMLWGSGRMATYFSDPLVFGYTSITFSLICFASINLFEKSNTFINLFKVIGIVVGIYLSIKSGSRTGWAALPLVMIFILMLKFKSEKYITITNIFLFTFIFLLVIYLISDTVSSRIKTTIEEIINYSWYGIAPETSVSFRITFYRIAWDLFSQNPWFGFGDIKLNSPELPVEITSYASNEAIYIALASGFHNEIITNAIRSGIFGMIASTILFIGPFFILINQIKSNSIINKANAFIGLVFIMCIFVSSITTEVFDLKYTASLYSILIALLCGSAITIYENDTHNQSS